jgi:amidase
MQKNGNAIIFGMYAIFGRPYIIIYFMKWCFLVLWITISSASNCQNNLLPDNGAKRIHFIPEKFSNSFSLNIAPVLKIKSGDTVLTETVDAGGYDKNGVKRQRGGNPLTGPFYIENSRPGDFLAVTFTRIALNRSYAYTTQAFVSRSLPKSTIKLLPRQYVAKWNLDVKTGFATPDSSFEHLQYFKVPLHPFLGCVGVAPSTGKNEVLSFFQGAYGGNLDFSSITQKATIYLPVFHEGAYLYIGDGHALQGDGELAGNALETSMEVEFTVNLIRNDTAKFLFPRVEDSTYIMAIGIDNSLDGALKNATSGLLEWLQNEYHLNLVEATQVISTSIEYNIAEIADPNVEVVAKMKKEILKGLLQK